MKDFTGDKKDENYLQPTDDISQTEQKQIKNIEPKHDYTEIVETIPNGIFKSKGEDQEKENLLKKPNELELGIRCKRYMNMEEDSPTTTML